MTCAMILQSLLGTSVGSTGPREKIILKVILFFFLPSAVDQSLKNHVT